MADGRSYIYNINGFVYKLGLDGSMFSLQDVEHTFKSFDGTGSKVKKSQGSGRAIHSLDKTRRIVLINLKCTVGTDEYAILQDMSVNHAEVGYKFSIQGNGVDFVSNCVTVGKDPDALNANKAGEDIAEVEFELQCSSIIRDVRGSFTKQ